MKGKPSPGPFAVRVTLFRSPPRFVTGAYAGGREDPDVHSLWSHAGRILLSQPRSSPGLSVCRSAEVSRSYGELGIVHRDESDQRRDHARCDLRFRYARRWVRRSIKNSWSRISAAAVDIVSIERVDGNDVSVGTHSSMGRRSTCSFVPKTPCPRVGVGRVRHVLHPQESSGANQVTQDFLVKLVLKADGTREGEDTATITLRGRASASTCRSRR